MPKNAQQEQARKAAAQMKARTQAYTEKVRKEFAYTVNEILALNKQMPKLEPGAMFSFDGQNKRIRGQVELLMRRLHSVVLLSVEKGIDLEWDAANRECDNLVGSLFGKDVLKSPNFEAWLQRNTAARDAFMQRTTNGLNLSERIWKSCEQLREEMEVAMTVAIGEGESAATMSRKVREYLNDPDLMFRRFRYKAGEKEVTDYDAEGNVIGTHKEPVYAKKWKKKVRTEDGRVKWIDYDKDSYKTGPGVYKSSAKNAMRVTRTETNMAYRAADHERWQQLDFVLGQKIQLSERHTEEHRDICDELAGDYPVDFKFIGWHPQCYCFATPILLDEDEMLAMSRARRNGEVYTPKAKPIDKMPDNFNKWVKENKGRIVEARDFGREPYFLRENWDKVDGIINRTQKPLTALERAEIRHAERTPEQVEAIKNAWAERRNEMNYALRPRSREEILAAAQKRHAERTVKQKQSIIDAFNERTRERGYEYVGQEKDYYLETIPIDEYKKTYGLTEKQATANNKTTRDVWKIKTTSGANLIIPKDVDMKRIGMSLEDIVNEINSVDPKILSSTTRFQILDYKAPLDYCYEKWYDIPNFEAAAYGGNGTINLHHVHKWSIKHTLSHEATHNLDKFSIGSYSSKKEWEDAVDSDTKMRQKLSMKGRDLYPTDYAYKTRTSKGGKSEDFADSMAAYLENKKTFAEKFPARAKILEKILKSL